jgi:REP element-mobilizing transposase RayT
LEYEGVLYHVTSRENAREDIFLDDKDRARFLEILGDVVARYGWICHAYCLVINHYHLLIETLEANLSSGMPLLNGVYTHRLTRLNDKEMIERTYAGRVAGAVTTRSDNGILAQGVTKEVKKEDLILA